MTRRSPVADAALRSRFSWSGFGVGWVFER